MPVPTVANVAGTKRGSGYQARLGSTLLRLAAAPDRAGAIESAPLEAERINLAENPEDFGNEFGARFSRSDFRGGEGLEFAHRRSQADTSDRYYDSRNVEVTQEGKVKLLHTTQEIRSSANTGLRATQTGGTVYSTDGTALTITADPEATTPTFSSEDPHAGEAASTVQDVVALGTTLYALVADGIHRKTSGGAWAHWHNASGADRIWAVKGRLLFSIDEALWEIDTAGTPTATLLVTLAAGETWNDVTDAGSHVLAAASDGYIYAFTFDGAAFTLDSQTYLEGEIPTALTFSFNVLVYATGQQLSSGAWVSRLYRTPITTTGGLGDIVRLKRFGDPDTETLDRRILWLRAGRDSVFAAVRETATEVDLWRYDLAYGGLHRSYIISVGGSSRDFLLVDGVPWTWIDGEGAYRRSSTLAASGYIISPLADFFRAEDKSWAAIGVTHSSIAGDGDAIAVAYTTDQDAVDDADSTSWTAIARSTSGQLPDEVSLSEVEARYLAVKVTLTAGAASPSLSAFVVRAYPGEGDTIITLPVNVSDQVEIPGRRRFVSRGYGAKVYAALAGVEGSSTELELYYPDELWSGLVEKVNTPLTQFSWRGTPLLVAMVRFRGRRVTATVTTGGTFGSQMFGEGVFGGEAA